MNEFGELIDDKTVRFERLLPGPIDRVWSYLVDAELKAKWFCGGDTEPKVGGKVDMRFHNASLSTQPDIAPPEKYRDLPEKMSCGGKVTRYDPPRALAHTWEFEGDHSEVSYELSESGDKVLLVLTHTRLRDRDEIISVCGGWHTHLDILLDVLEQRDPRPFWKSHTGIEEHYESSVP